MPVSCPATRDLLPGSFRLVSMRGRMGDPNAFPELDRAVRQYLGGSVRLAVFDTLSSLWGTRGESGEDGEDKAEGPCDGAKDESHCEADEAAEESNHVLRPARRLGCWSVGAK